LENFVRFKEAGASGPRRSFCREVAEPAPESTGKLVEFRQRDFYFRLGGFLRHYRPSRDTSNRGGRVVGKHEFCPAFSTITFADGESTESK
jgi:hypothetical protein